MTEEYYTPPAIAVLMLLSATWTEVSFVTIVEIVGALGCV